MSRLHQYNTNTNTGIISNDDDGDDDDTIGKSKLIAAATTMVSAMPHTTKLFSAFCFHVR